MPETVKLQKRMENKRLVYYRQKATAEYWDKHWKDSNINISYGIAETGSLHHPMWEKKFIEYLPQNGLIIEAGCGIGQLVLALEKRGYNVEGVEYAEKTVEMAKSRYPDLPIRIGDVTQLDVPDDHYSAYISIGVVEHRKDGPEPFLTEAYRILGRNGIALISVPHLNPMRKLKATWGLYNGNPNNLEFYQYAYSEEEYTSYLNSAGFQVIEIFNYGGVHGFRKEFPFSNFLLSLPFLQKRLQYRLSRRDRYRNFFGHMMMAVCRKQ